jgi:hypothetical protein
MPQVLTVRRVIVALLALGVLGGSHWLAYWLGARREHDRTAAFVNSLMENADNDALQVRVQALRIMARHTQDIPSAEVRSFCLMTESIADFVEKKTVAPNRQAGNDPEADRWQRQVDEGRRLSAILKREKG